MKKLLMAITVLATILLPLMGAVTAHAAGWCDGFFHKRAVPTKLSIEKILNLNSNCTKVETFPVMIIDILKNQ